MASSSKSPRAALADLELFGTRARVLTSSTRFGWTPDDNEIFKDFATESGIVGPRAGNRSRSSIRSAVEETDLDPLLEDLDLLKFAAVTNDKGQKLGPIIEVKVRRKMEAIAASLLAEAPKASTPRKGAARATTTPTPASRPEHKPATRRSSRLSVSDDAQQHHDDDDDIRELYRAEDDLARLERELDSARRRVERLQLRETASSPQTATAKGKVKGKGKAE